MDELVELVAKKTGLSKEQAQTAVDTVMDYLKQKLPAPIGGQLEALLGNENVVNSLAQGLEGLLGKK
jgi:uncharacterized protein (DUF2267 family)